MPQVTLNVVDRIPQGSEGESLWKDGTLQEYEVQIVYESDEGVIQVPVAGRADEKPARIVRMHSGLYRKTVTFSAKRVGTPPILPDYTALEDEVLLRRKNGFGNPVLWDTDGAFFQHSAWGVYTYALLEKPTKEAGFRSAFTLYYANARVTYRAPMFRTVILDW